MIQTERYPIWQQSERVRAELVRQKLIDDGTCQPRLIGGEPMWKTVVRGTVTTVGFAINITGKVVGALHPIGREPFDKLAGLVIEMGGEALSDCMGHPVKPHWEHYVSARQVELNTELYDCNVRLRHCDDRDDQERSSFIRFVRIYSMTALCAVLLVVAGKNEMVLDWIGVAPSRQTAVPVPQLEQPDTNFDASTSAHQ